MTKPKIFHLGLCVAPANAPKNAMQQAFIDNSSEYRELNCGVENVNEKVFQICSEFQPDFLFMQIQAEGVIYPNTVKQVTKMGIFVINWTGDVRASVPQWMMRLEDNVTTFSNMRDVRDLNALGKKSVYLEIGYDQNIYCPEGKVNPVEPIVFFGNSYGEAMFPLSEFRIKMCVYLKHVFGGRFGVYGTGWNMASGNFNHSQPEEAAAYRSAKIAINCSHFEIEKYSSDRLLRILGTGTAICLAKHYPGIEEDFVDGYHLRYWRTIEELKGLCDYYLDPVNEFERRNIASYGMILARKKFTFDNMAKNVIKIWEENK